MADWYFDNYPKLSPKQAKLLKRLAKELKGEDLKEITEILTRFTS